MSDQKTLRVKDFWITTEESEEFLFEMDQVCQKYAVKGQDKKLEYGFVWGGV